MNAIPDILNPLFETENNIQFSDVFDLEDIQHFQNLFSNACGVASIITHPDGTPITQSSNFCRLCDDIIRKSEKGIANCYQSDKMIGRYNPSGAIIWPCLSCGLWDAGASITVGGKHIANWLIGQVRNEALDVELISQYADTIEVDRDEFRTALNEVPVMSFEQFDNVAKMLFAFANELSDKGYKNLQLKIKIAERDKAIKLLQENEIKYTTIFENVHEVFYQTDLNGTILGISPSIKYFTEFQKDELISTSVHHLYYNPDDRVTLLETILKDGELRDYELKLKTKANKLKHVSINARLIYDDKNRPNHIAGAIRDITDNKQAEQVMLESEESYRSLFENMLNGFAYCQMLYEDGHPQDFIYIKVNKAFVSLSGLKNVEGKKVSEVIQGIREHDQKLLEIYGRVASTGEPEFFEMYVESLTDWYAISVYSPKKGFFIAIFDVITARKKVIQELIAAKQKAEESDRLKTAFLNNISHEIRTPFNGILGFLSLIQDDDLSDNERNEYIGIINENADRLMCTINDIVEISQIQIGQLKLSTTETNCKSLIEELADSFRPDIEKKGLAFIVHNDLPDNMVDINTDSTKLKSILSNLIRNAKKFTKAGSIELGIRLNGNHLEFSIKDTGIGIAKNKHPLIFERFNQVDVSLTRQYEGLGLGLSITKTYVEALGGRIWLESEEGKGSTFYFTILYSPTMMR